MRETERERERERERDRDGIYRQKPDITSFWKHGVRSHVFLSIWLFVFVHDFFNFNRTRGSSAKKSPPEEVKDVSSILTALGKSPSFLLHCLSGVNLTH